MEIYNKTCVPTRILVPLIEEAVVVIECPNLNFTIKFTAGKYLRGIAHSQNYLCSIILPISTKNGISLWWKEDPELPVEIYKTIVHEFDHISCYQHGIRGCELRAQIAEQRALKEMSTDLLVELTDWLEKVNSNKNIV